MTHLDTPKIQRTVREGNDGTARFITSRHTSSRLKGLAKHLLVIIGIPTDKSVDVSVTYPFGLCLRLGCCNVENQNSVG
jgi:hypothetical protein